MTPVDVIIAYSITHQAAANEGVNIDDINTWIRGLVGTPGGDFVIRVLTRELGDGGALGGYNTTPPESGRYRNT